MPQFTLRSAFCGVGAPWVLWSACEVSCLWAEEQQELRGFPTAPAATGSRPRSASGVRAAEALPGPSWLPEPRAHGAEREVASTQNHLLCNKHGRGCAEPPGSAGAAGTVGVQVRGACAYTPPPVPVWTRALLQGRCSASWDISLEPI